MTSMQTSDNTVALMTFKPMYGRVTRADRLMVSMMTSGRIRSRDVQPEYEDED